MGKIDEQISYNWLFFLLAGAFGAVTFWAVYDETATRREYKVYQEAFFSMETNMAKKAWEEAKAALEKTDGWKKTSADLKRLEEQRKKTSADEAKAAARLQELDFTAFDKQQNYTFTKSHMDEFYYYYTLAKHGITMDTPKDSQAYKEFEEKRAKYEAFGVQLAKDEAVMNAAAADRDCAKLGRAPERPSCDVMNAADYVGNSYNAAGKQVAVEAYSDGIDKTQKDLDTLELPMKALERKYLAAKDKEGSGPLGLFGPATEIVQENIEDIGRVDRCESCHMGENRAGFETVTPKYFQSHPYRRTLLSIHPVDKFGCTTCHDGQGRATTEFYAHAPTDDHHYAEKHFWEFPLLKGAFMESECRQCHRNEVELRSNIQCEIDAECPDQGTGTDKVKLKCAPLAAALDPAGGPGTPTEAKIEEGKYCGTPNQNDETKIDPVLVDLAPHLSRGRKIIDEVACYGCHPVEGYENRPKAGPDLRHAAAKLNPGWMVSWIQNPKAFRPNSRMPNFFPELLHPEEYPESAKPKYIDATAEIGKVTETDPVKREQALNLLAAEHFQPTQQATILASFLLGNSSPFAVPDESTLPVGDATRGEKLVDTLGCYGCHNLTKPGEKPMVHANRASHYDNGPDLGNIGVKTSRAWIYAWVKDPKSFAPQTRMPNLRLSDQEASDIATYLSGNTFVDGKPTTYPPAPMVNPRSADYQVLGKKLVAFYGCYGCHYVKGFETRAVIGADLTEFGDKETARLDYGDYIVSHTKQTWEAWLENKLKHPRVYRYERVDTRMPQFDLQKEEIDDVMVVLKGMRGKTKDDDALGHKLSAVEMERERGRDLVRYYNCNGCHSFDGKRGDIRALDAFQTEDGPRFAPPLLYGEGAKTQPNWLFGFLKAPSPLRPHLSIRMPTFGFADADATSLVAMFSALDGATYPYQDNSGFKLEGDRKVEAQTAFKTAQCTQCHTLGDTPTPEMAQKGAPNLLLAKTRLRPEWLARWIRDPPTVYRGTDPAADRPDVNMPSFFSNGNPLKGADQSPANASLPGIHALSSMSGPDVVYLLRDLLMTVEAPSPAQAAGATPAATSGKLKKKKAEAPVPGVKHAAR